MLQIHLPLPSGYYDNAFMYPAAVTTARKVCQNPLSYALDLVKKAKPDVIEEYMKSLADFLVIKGRLYTLMVSFFVSNLRRARVEMVVYGWVRPRFGGPATTYPSIGCCIPYKNSNGINGMLVPLCLPALVVERFKVELDAQLKVKQAVKVAGHYSRFMSSLYGKLGQEVWNNMKN